jgi:hypothetical protein
MKRAKKGKRKSETPRGRKWLKEAQKRKERVAKKGKTG